MKELLARKIAAVIGVKPEEVSISIPDLDNFGHYSTNVAMRLAKEMKRAPFELATEFARKLQEEDGLLRVLATTSGEKAGMGNSANGAKMFAKVEAVKPGFINIWLSEQLLQAEFAKGSVALNVGQEKTVIVEYAAPNIAKPMHVGHLRSTIIGDALANIHTYLGYNVVRWNYFGDWGTQFGKLITAYKLWGKKEEVEKDPIGTMLGLYVRVSSEAKTNPALEDQARAEFKKLEDGDAENRKLWEWFKDESLIEFHKMFKRLGVKFDLEIGESFYEEAMYDVLKELEQKELLIPGEEGSKIVNLDAQKLPVALIQKSDGASLYITRDIASMKHRLSRYKPAKLLYVVANQQALHFEQLFAITDLLGLKSAEKTHVKFGMVLGEDGKKFATREGKLIKLEDLLDQAVAGAYKVVAEKNKDLSEGEKQAVAEAVGIGAIKYNDLKENRNSDIVFNWEQMLDLHGDTAPYLQYTAVRLANITRKVDVKPNSDLSAVDDDLKSGLVKKILDFNDVVSLCAETYYTSHLAKYLFELAKLGNQYYETHRILEDENKARQAGRLALLTSVSETIKKGLGLLGIAVPERI
jgi:arginyl-tRNA synthetase